MEERFAAFAVGGQNCCAPVAKQTCKPVPKRSEDAGGNSRTICQGEDKSHQAFAHYARSGRVLVCGDARVSLYTPNSLFQDSALTAGSTRKVKDAGERWGTPPPIPPTTLL